MGEDRPIYSFLLSGGENHGGLLLLTIYFLSWEIVGTCCHDWCHILHLAEQLSPERPDIAKVYELSERIKGELKEELDDVIEKEHVLQSPFKLKLKDGNEYEAVTSCKGFPSNPLSKEEIDFKFNALASRVLGKEKALNIYSMLNSVGEVGDISKLARAMCR